MPPAVRSVDLKCVVTCDLTPRLLLNDHPVDLLQSGKDWSGPATVQVTDLLDIECTVRGVADEDWSILITTKCPDGVTPDRVFSPPTGKIPSGGKFRFFAAAKVPATPCTPKKDD